jgi:hypothetical protein
MENMLGNMICEEGKQPTGIHHVGYLGSMCGTIRFI